MNGIDEFTVFLNAHSAQLVASSVPELYWNSLFLKLKNQILDVGQTFMFADVGDDDFIVTIRSEEGVKCSDCSQIYLIDHAWTFEARNAILQLRTIPGLLDRMALLMNISSELSMDRKIDEVYKEMWKYCRTYSQTIPGEDTPLTLWYIMDEFGSRIRHSNNPNFRAVPFYHQPEGFAYTILFPITDVADNEEVFIDYVEGVSSVDQKTREAFLVPWTNQSFITEDNVYFSPDIEYFLSGSQLEKFPENPTMMPNLPNRLKVYADYSFVQEYLDHPGFEIVNNENEADVLWLMRHFYDFQGLIDRKPATFINQFPCERVITTKDLLAITARNCQEEPVWLPLTYNLLKEVSTFVGVFQRREVAGEDNHWICKPWNLARGLDMTVTNNINCILRLPFSGPKVAQKYVENPVLFNRNEIGGVKFDIRYVILLVSVEPLKLYCYKNFFLRFANKAFSLDDLWDYEKHFTVMNYREDSNLHHMKCHDFIEEFSKQYIDYPWHIIEADILKCIREMFEAAVCLPPPKGLAHLPQSRALYAADLVLSWKEGKMQPMLLEINFAPDCERACRYYPSFYNDVFGLLFKNEINENEFHIL